MTAPVSRAEFDALQERVKALEAVASAAALMLCTAPYTPSHRYSREQEARVSAGQSELLRLLSPYIPKEAKG
jgi:hypothetical protein